MEIGLEYTWKSKRFVVLRLVKRKMYTKTGLCCECGFKIHFYRNASIVDLWPALTFIVTDCIPLMAALE